jgi:hypothetical protein
MSRNHSRSTSPDRRVSDRRANDRGVGQGTADRDYRGGKGRDDRNNDRRNNRDTYTNTNISSGSGSGSGRAAGRFDGKQVVAPSMFWLFICVAWHQSMNRS